MPYKLIPAEKHIIDPNMVAAIAQELRLRRLEGPPDAPIIIEEQVPRSNRVYVTVIWNAWHDIAPEDRGRIILDAYQNTLGTNAALTVSTVLGLTHAEANRLGVKTA